MLLGLLSLCSVSAKEIERLRRTLGVLNDAFTIPNHDHPGEYSHGRVVHLNVATLHCLADKV